MINIPVEYIKVSDLTEAQRLATLDVERFFFNKEVYGTASQRGFWECILVSDI